MSNFTHTIKEVWSSGGRSIEDQHSHSGDAQDSRDVDVADSTTDEEVIVTLDVSEIKGIYMVADGALTVETNDGTTPDDTIVLVADQPLIWYNGSYHANPFSADITALYLTNASGASVRFQLEVVYDSTP